MVSFVYFAATAATLLGLAGAQSTTSTSSAAYAISTDGNCGGTTNETCAGSTYGGCCSKNGFCGSTDPYCGSGCQDAFALSGACQGVNSSISTTGSCGKDAGLICTGSRWGNCCSAHNFCGGNSTYCRVGCQDSWGECGSSAETNSSATASASPSAAPPSQQKTPVTQTTGFKAGISVMAVVLGLVLIGALAFFLLRRRRRNARGGHAASDGMARKSELDAEKPVPAPVHAGDANVKPYAQPSELSAVSRPQELPANDRERDRLAKVDDRAAAGYEGAYRGN